MQSPLLKACLMLLVLPLLGCGAIFNGTRQNITATSAPDVATVTTNPGNMQFTTPASLSLERKNDYTLTFTKEGYRPANFQINKSLQGGILVLDILFTGLIGVVVDAATGAWYKLSPETAIVSLTPADGADTRLKPIEISISSRGDELRIKATEPVNVRVTDR